MVVLCKHALRAASSMYWCIVDGLSLYSVISEQIPLPVKKLYTHFTWSRSVLEVLVDFVY